MRTGRNETERYSVGGDVEAKTGTASVRVSNRKPIKERAITMNDPDNITDFLHAVDNLRGADESVRTTAHTSSVSAEGWPTAPGDVSAK